MKKTINNPLPDLLRESELPRGRAVPELLLGEFKRVTDYMTVRLEMLTKPVIAFSGKEKISG